MVRNLLLSLALANVLFFGWAHWVDVAPAGRAAANTPALQLTPTGAAPAGGKPEAAATTAAAVAAAAARCVSLGPLADAAAVTALSTALRARNLNPRARTVQGAATDGYWVYIDKLRDPLERARALRRLARGGVRDAAALAESGQVSVGLFSEKSGADKRAAAVRAAGFEPVIEARSHEVSENWLDVDLASDIPAPAVPALTAGLNLGAEPGWRDCPAATADGEPGVGANGGVPPAAR